MLSVRGAGMLAAILGIAAVSGLLLAAPAITTSAQVFDENNEKIIRIGTILSATDPGSHNPHDDRFKAMELARDDFNAAQDTYRLELMDLRVSGESDSHAHSRAGAKLMEAFENYSITYFVGPMGSTDTTSTKAQLALLEPANPGSDFIVISPASTALSLRADDSVFRMTIDDSVQAVEISNLLRADGKTHAVLIGLNSHHTEPDGTPERDIWSVGLEESFTANYARQGTIDYHLTIAIRDNDENEPGRDTYDSFASDLNDKVSGLIDDYGADSVAVVMMGYSADISHLVQAINRDASLDSLGDVAWYGPDGIATRSELTNNVEVGRFLAKVGLAATQYAGEDNELKSDVESRLVSAGVASTSSIYLYSSYDAVSLLAHVIAEREDNGQTQTVKELLHELADGPVGVGTLGDYSFGPNGDLDEPLSYKTWRIVLDSDSVPVWTDKTVQIMCR